MPELGGCSLGILVVPVIWILEIHKVKKSATAAAVPAAGSILTAAAGPAAGSIPAIRCPAMES